MTFQSLPIYVSERSAKNMWQDYAVYPEGVELKARLILKTFVIQAEDIIDVKLVHGLSFWNPAYWADPSHWFALKLDWADICEHVSLHRRSGMFKYIRFTPDNPAKFVAACRSIVMEDSARHFVPRTFR